MYVLQRRDEMNKVYQVEYFDRGVEINAQGIPTEDAVTIGYFTSKKQASYAVEQCVAARLRRDCLRTNEFSLSYGNAQTEVYVLIYEFYREELEGTAEYYYTFSPRLSKEDCNKLRHQLVKLPEYCKTGSKHFYESEDGFRIERYYLNDIHRVSAFD